MRSVEKIGSTRSLARSPFSMLADVAGDLGGMFDLFSSPGVRSSAMPVCDMVEKDTHYLYSFDLPGVDKKNLKVEVHNATLKVSGERKSEHNESAYSEKSYGRFERSISLPHGIKEDSVYAHHENGVLTVAIAKSSANGSKKVNIVSGKKEGVWAKLLN